jgi:multidrug resistance efflux pump
LHHQLTIERATLRNAEAEQRRQGIEVGRAKQEHRRRLALEGLLSQEEEEKARFQAETAGALFEAAEAEVSRVEARIAQLETRLQRSQMRAPFDGTVAQRYLDPGTIVGPGTPILRLISGDRLLSRFAIPPEEVDSVATGTSVRVEVDHLGLSLVGVVEHLAPEIDAASQLLFVEARITDGAPGVAAIPSGAAARVAVQRPGEPPPPSCFAPR